jgi:hypothetical protein
MITVAARIRREMMRGLGARDEVWNEIKVHL